MDALGDPTPAGARFSLAFPATLRELSVARDRLGSWLTDLGVDDDSVLDLTVVFSELGANAVAATAASGQVRVVADVEGSGLVLEVTNGSPAPDRPPLPTTLDEALGTGGRGLLIVQALSDEVELSRGPDGAVTVRCRVQWRSKDSYTST